ncbi:MAG: ribosome biogenesis GTPase YlqF [Clostridia bacterium]|nr:ribosome biogenesis GTPase YlqF [Clostridia bacterium]
MAAGLRPLRQYLKVVDVVLEVADARLPVSSRYPDLASIIGSKTRLLVLTRADLADPKLTAQWLEFFRSQGTTAFAINARTGEGSRALRQQLAMIAKEKRQTMAHKGFRGRPLRIMAAGIPNVGKSSLINRLAGRSAARTGNRPGITRGPQWLRFEGNIELLDTPGVLWTHWHEQRTALWLGTIGCAPEGVLAAEDIADLLAEYLLTNAPDNLKIRYNLKEGQLTKQKLFESIAERRGFISFGGVFDLEKSATALINDFREGYLGRFTLEAPKQD